MKTAMDDRASILNTEIAGLRLTLQDQNAQIANRSGYTDDEIRSNLTRRLAVMRNEFDQEVATQQVVMQSEGNVARMYKGMMVPFGAKVDFKPSEARKSEAPSKFSPRSIPGIFAGYEIDTTSF